MSSWYLVSCTIWTFILFMTRPNEHDFALQLRSPSLAWYELASLKFNEASDFNDRLNYNSDMVQDYFVITLAYPPKAKPGVVFVGLLGKWLGVDLKALSWGKAADVNLAVLIHVGSYVGFSLLPFMTGKILRGNRVALVMTGAVVSDSLTSMVYAIYMLAHIGQAVRNMIPSPHASVLFWGMYGVAPAIATAVTGMTLEGFYRPSGPLGGMVVLCTYGVLNSPGYRFLLMDKFKLSFVGVYLLQVILHLIQNPRRRVIALGFELFVMSVFGWMVYRAQRPGEVLTFEKILDLIMPSSYY